MSVAPQPQTSLYEVEIENPDVEAALEKRQKQVDAARAVNKRKREADAAAKSMLEDLELGDDAPVRIGRFVVTRKARPSRTVAFETAPGVRVSIKPLPAEGE